MERRLSGGNRITSQLSKSIAIIEENVMENWWSPYRSPSYRSNEKQLDLTCRISRAEEAALLQACAGDCELDCFVRIGLDTGCRADEIAHLRWVDLDLDEGTGMIRCASDWHSKTRKNRFIAFTPVTVSSIRRWRVQRGLQPYVFHNDGDRKRKVYDRVRRKFGEAVTRAGIKRRTLHDLRRTVGTLLAERGVSVIVKGGTETSTFRLGYHPAWIACDIDFRKRVYHLDKSQEKLKEISARYGAMMDVRLMVDDGRMMITAISDDMNLDQLEQEMSLVGIQEYLVKSRALAK